MQGNSDGPLVPMVRLVPREKHINLMVLLVDMHLIKGTWIIFYVISMGTRQFQWSIGTNGTIGTNRKAHQSNGSIGGYASH